MSASDCPSWDVRIASCVVRIGSRGMRRFSSRPSSTVERESRVLHQPASRQLGSSRSAEQCEFFPRRTSRRNRDPYQRKLSVTKNYAWRPCASTWRIGASMSHKIGTQLGREGTRVERCTIERLRPQFGIQSIPEVDTVNSQSSSSWSLG